MGISGLVRRVKRADSPFYAGIKKTARWVFSIHVPVVCVTKPVFSGLYWLHVFLCETFAMLAKFFWFEPLLRSRCESVGRGLHMERLPYITGSGRIVIGEGVRLSGKSDIGFSNRHHNDPELLVGDGTFIGHGCAFDVAEAVRIGNHCLIAGGVSISDNDGHPLDVDARRRGEPVGAEQVKPVTICDDVWIGRGALILKGVTVGAGAIVGAHAVVTRDVPPLSIVAGNPAKVVKELAPSSARTGA